MKTEKTHTCEGCDKPLTGKLSDYACIDGMYLCEPCEDYDKQESQDGMFLGVFVPMF